MVANQYNPLHPRYEGSRLLSALLWFAYGAAAATTNNNNSLPRRYPEKRDLIVGGRDAPVGRYPYYARLDYEGDFGCGATLIAPDFILTAAHCALPEDVGTATATVGAVTRLDIQAPANATTYRRVFRELFRHPAYIDPDNDLALVRIDPIPLAVTALFNRDRRFPRPGANVTVIGLGLTSNNGQDANELQEVQLQVVGDGSCDRAYQGDLYRKAMICAAATGLDSCDGDSGGPLLISTHHLYNNNNSNTTQQQDVPLMMVVGVVSFGMACASPKYPGVYAEVSYASAWIDEVLCQHSISPPQPCRNASQTFVLTPEQECRDYPGAFYINRWYQFQRCSWLVAKSGRLEEYCRLGTEAWIQCPFTCHACSYENDDDSVPGLDDDQTPRATNRLARNHALMNSNFTQASTHATMIAVLILSLCLFCQGVVWSAFRCRAWHHRHRAVKAAAMTQFGATGGSEQDVHQDSAALGYSDMGPDPVEDAMSPQPINLPCEGDQHTTSLAVT